MKEYVQNKEIIIFMVFIVIITSFVTYRNIQIESNEKDNNNSMLLNTDK